MKWRASGPTRSLPIWKRLLNLHEILDGEDGSFDRGIQQLKSRRFLWFARLAALMVSLGFAWGIGEVLMRVSVGPPIIWKFPQEHYSRDPDVGHRLAPSQFAFTHDKRFVTDEHGLRIPETTRGREPASRRILALGDSQTAGDGVTFEQSWPGQLEAALNQGAPGGEWQVVNAGVSGYAPWQYAIQLGRHADRFDLDGVVVGLYVNDVTPRPATVDAYVVTNTLSRRIGYVLKRSALFTALWRARHGLQQRLSPAPNFGRETRILTGEPDPLVEKGWQALETSLREIREFCHARKLPLTLLVLPSREQVRGTEPGRAYNERIAGLASQLDASHVDVLGALQMAYDTEGERLFITWDGHNSAVANRIIGSQVGAEVLR